MLRIRTQIGTWRLQDVHQSDTMRFLIQRLEKEHNTVIQHPFTSDQMGKFPLEDNLTVQSARFTNGQMLYLRVDETKTGVHEAALSGKKITKDGHIVQQDISSVLNSSGFRPGMLPLRSMKMQWTLNEFVALDEQFEYKIKHQPDPNCSKLTINSSCVNDFQSYMRNFDFRVLR